ncbi:MAG: MOSC domain-containing protein [Verrucomicrobiaceae bacterium]|nr:MAG: MOSC domain-containing protein [Verrucomicrobiaceae bacterium]
MSTAKLLTLHTGKARQIESGQSGEWWDKPWETGFRKESRTEPCWLGYEGFRTDEQADRKHHGGPEKAVCVYSSEHYAYWHEALGMPDLPHGAFGENLTTEGMVETGVCIGDRFSLGEAELQVSQPRQPCWKLARRWRVKDLAARVEQNGFTGFYFRVLRHGHVKPGDVFALIERTFPQWSISRCNEIMHHSKQDSAAAKDLAECHLLSSSWKDSLWLRSEKKSAASSELRTRQPD